MKKLLKSVPSITFIFCLLTFIIGSIIGWQLGHTDLKFQWNDYKPQFSAINQSPPSDKKELDFKLFWDVWNMVSNDYVDKKAIDPQKMYYGAIQGMVSALGDPYTVFLPPEAQKSTKEELGGSFEGIGAQLGFNKDKRLVVIAPLSDTPAEKAGILAGDMILKVDKKDTSNLSLPEAVNLIKGPKGTDVTLEIFREGESATRDITIKRDTIIVKSVDFSEKVTPSGKKIAYIRLSRFGERTSAEWQEAVSKTLASGAKGVILDVRNNPGGFLEGAVFIASEFVEKGNIVMHEDGQGNRKGYPASGQGKILNLPLMVLINKGSASASEIVSGAIQDYKRGKLVGEQSFGKGTIQESQDLPGDTGIHITKAKWLTPEGRWIHTTGLTPDVVVEPIKDPAEQIKKDTQLDKALELLN